MKTTFKIDFVDGHVLINDNGKRILVDTGSPLTVHKERCFSFLGRDHSVSVSILGSSVRDLAALTGFEFTTLLGMDIMSQYKVVFDYENKELTFLTEEEPDIVGTPYPLINIMGVKALRMNINGHNLIAAVDTGAPLSYIDKDITSNVSPVGEKEDFYPTVGRFATPIYSLETEFAGKQFTVDYGILPGMMAVRNKVQGINAVVGYDFLKNFKLMFNFRSGTVIVA